MKSFKTIPGNQSLYEGTLYGAKITVDAGSVRITECTNQTSGVVKKIVVNVTAGSDVTEFVSGDDVTDGSADGFYVAAHGAPDLIPSGAAGSYDAVTDLSYEVTPAPTRDATNVTLTLSEIEGMKGNYVGDLIDSVPGATHVSFRWDGPGELAIKPPGGLATYADWPTIQSGATGIWHLDTLRTLTVYNTGVQGKLHLLFLKDEGRGL